MPPSDEYYFSQHVAANGSFESVRLVSQNAPHATFSSSRLLCRVPHDENNPRLVPASSTFLDLVITLTCSRLTDLSIQDRLWPSLGSSLGHGASFSVERREAKGRKLVAVKHIRRDGIDVSGLTSNSSAKKRLDDVFLEVRVLCHLNTLHHENIVELIGYGWDSGPLPFLVLEFADLGSLDAFLKLNKLSWSQKELTLVQLASGLEMLHACGVIHGDIKLENILVFSKDDDGFVPKFADFGFCLAESLGAAAHHGTSVLNPPELRDSNARMYPQTRLDFEKADVYSYGLAAWEIAQDGHRYYTCHSINIDAKDVSMVLTFLSSIEAIGQELVDFAIGFVQALELPKTSEKTLSEVLSLALRRTPESRADIRDIRLIMDTEDIWEPVIAIPLKQSSYSIFDISSAPVPSDVRTELMSTLKKSSAATPQNGRSLDSFNMAAFHALGFGTPQNDDLSLQSLVEAAIFGHRAAMFYCRAFLDSGLLSKNAFSASNFDIDDPFFSPPDSEITSRPDEKAACQIRYAHSYWLQYSVPKLYFQDISICELTAEALLDVIPIGQIHDLEIEVDAEGKVTCQPLLHCLAKTSPALVEELLQLGVDGSTIASDNQTLLHIACELGSMGLFETLIERYPDLGAIHTSDGLSPLHWLFMFTESDIPRVAAALGALTSLHDRIAVRFLRNLNLVFSGPPLHWAIMAHNLHAVQAILSLGVDLNKLNYMPPDCLNYPGRAVDLASCFLMPEVIKLLEKHGAHLHHGDQDSSAVSYVGYALDPFRLWLYHGTTVDEQAQKTLELLISRGLGQEPYLEATVLVNLVSRTTCHTSVLRHFLSLRPAVSKETLRLAAISYQHDSMNADEMIIILDYCANCLSQEEFNSGCVSALIRCAEDGTVGAAKAILDRLGSEAKAVIDEEGLMHRAAEYDHSNMIELLLERGGNINMNVDGTPAATAAFSCSRNALRYLLTHGAVATTSGNDGCYSLLHDIVSNTSPARESEPTLQMVCGEFADIVRPVVDMYDSRGLTALHEATIWANIKNVATLLNLGARPLKIRDTDICLLGLTQLCKEYLPWVITQQGERAIWEYKKNVDLLAEWLQDTMCIEPPKSVFPDEKLLRSWRTPQESQWRPSDGMWDWYIPDLRSDTTSDLVEWWGIKWRPNANVASDKIGV